MFFKSFMQKRTCKYSVAYQKEKKKKKAALESSLREILSEEDRSYLSSGSMLWLLP